jgi:hypothetical protein
MPRFLELAKLPEDDRPPQRDGGSRRIETELDPQRPAELELAFEPVGGHHLRRARHERGQNVGSHGAKANSATQTGPGDDASVRLRRSRGKMV